MIGTFLNGKLGLGKTYWFGVVGFGIIFQFFSRYITQQYLTTVEVADVARLDLIHKGGMVVATIITLLLLRAVYLAATDDRTPGGWGWLGIAIAALGVANIGYVTATLLFPSIPTPRFMLQREIDEMQKQLPQLMQPGVTMRAVAIVEDELIYYIDVDDPALEENVQMVENLFKPDTVDGAALCRDFEGYFRGGVSLVAYEYSFSNMDIRSTLTGEECLAFLASE